MLRNIKNITCMIAMILVIGGCEKKEYSMGSLTTPSEVVIGTKIIGQDATHPNGDGSGDVEITLTGKNVLAYMIDYDASDGIKMELLPSGKITKKYAKNGVNTYRITVVAGGTGGTATTITKEIQVRSDFTPEASILTNLFGATGTKTWKVDKDLAGHFGVGPWAPASVTPEWWSAPPNDKAGCCNCFYTAAFTFTKAASGGDHSITTATPDGAFTKTGALAGGLPGLSTITGPEGCYAYAGGTSTFGFMRSGSGVAASAPSTSTSILLGGNNTFIGYGALLKEYEILSITPTTMYLRVQGTETGNAWYLKMKSN